MSYMCNRGTAGTEVADLLKGSLNPRSNFIPGIHSFESSGQVRRSNRMIQKLYVLNRNSLAPRWRPEQIIPGTPFLFPEDGQSGPPADETLS